MRLSLLIAGFLLVGLFGMAVAQNGTLPAKEPLPELPDPGQKPGDFFYFLDQWTEALGEFFTFNPEAKALLQTERALERIAEIKALLEIKGVDAPGLAVAQEKILANMARASQILKQQKAKGREVTQLAQKLDDDFDARQELLKQTFKVEKAKLKVQKEEVKLQILQARQAGDFEKVGQLRATLIEIETQKDTLEQKWEVQEELLELEEEKLEAELEAEERELEELEENEEDLLDQKEKEIERAFKQREKALELQERSLEIDLKKALREGDTVLAEQIRAQLLELEVQKEALETEEEAAEKALEKEEKKFEKARDLKERAEEQIEEAKEEIADVVEKVKEMTEEIPAVSELLSEAQNKLTAAEKAFEAEKYGEAYGQAMAAEMLARNAEKKIEQEEELEEKFEEFEEKLEEAEKSERKWEAAQRALKEASEEEREEIEEDLEASEKYFEERREELKEIEEFRKEIERKMKQEVEEVEEEEVKVGEPEVEKEESVYPDNYSLKFGDLPQGFQLRILEEEEQELGYISNPGFLENKEVWANLYSGVDISKIAKVYFSVYVNPKEKLSELGAYAVQYKSESYLDSEIHKIQSSSRIVYLRERDILVMVWSDSLYPEKELQGAIENLQARTNLAKVN